MLSRLEIFKDTAQVAVETAATRVGRIAGIIANAVRDVTREVGGLATDLFEMAEAARRAGRDAANDSAAPQAASEERDSSAGGNAR